MCELSVCVDEFVNVVDRFQGRGLGVSLRTNSANPDKKQSDLVNAAYYPRKVNIAPSGVEGFLEGEAADRSCEGSADRALVYPVPD